MYDGIYIQIEMETKTRDRVVRRKDSLTLDGQLAGACDLCNRNTQELVPLLRVPSRLLARQNLQVH